MSFIQTPEFWSSVAFLSVAVGIAGPCSKRLKRWGANKAEAIMARQREAESVLKKAETLKKQYETAYQNRYSERQKRKRETEKEIRFLEQEALQQSEERMTRKQQEIGLRLKVIEENGRQDMKRKIVSRVIKQAEGKLMHRENEDGNILVEKVCQALDRYGSVLKR